MLINPHNGPAPDGVGIGADPEVMWTGMAAMLGTLGDVVHNSKYNCYTRVNITLWGNDWAQRAAEICATTGIDFVGLDPYRNTNSAITGYLNELADINGNFPHIPENGGEYLNNDLLELLTFTKGGGYEVFEVVTTPDPQLSDWTLRGVYYPDFTPKPQTQRLIDANAIFNKAGYDIVMSELGNMRGFNLLSNGGDDVLVQTLFTKTSAVSVKWTTTERGVAFVIENEGYLTFASTKVDTMEFGNCTIKSIEFGYYNSDMEWVREGTTSAVNTINLLPGRVYRAVF